MSSNPSVSILVSIYNGEKFIRGFLEDAARQSIFESCEFLLLDAQSNDSTPNIINEFIHLKPFRYIKLDQRYSIYDTWNIGVSLALSPILSNWNIDDRRHPDSLRWQLEHLLFTPKCDVCYGATAWSHVPNEKFEDNKLDDIYPCEEVGLDSFMRSNPPHCMPMWRKILHQHIGEFNPYYPTAGDFEFWVRCYNHGKIFCRIPKIVGLYYYNPCGLSTSNNSNNIKEAMFIRRNYLFK